MSSDLSGTQVIGQRIIVRDAIFTCQIGVTEAERARPQRLRVNLTLEVAPRPPERDEVGEVLNYSKVVAVVREACRSSHFNLVESLAEAVAARCFGFARVEATRIRVEKLERYEDVAAIGVEIERRRDA